MKKLASSLFIIALGTGAAWAQGSAPPAASNGNSTAASSASIPPPPAITANSTPIELARAALAAQGGDKFKNVKSMWLVGNVDLYAPNSASAMPGKFSLVTAGERMRLDIESPAFKFKQIYDGQQSFSSIPGMQTPPSSKFGLLVLTKFEQPGYTVSALPNDKKLRGFRIVDAEGNTTDFFIDPATARVIKYLSPFNGYTFGIENTKFKEVEGVLVPFNFTQRLELTQGAFFAEYKVKEAKVNQPLTDDVFLIQ